MGIPVIDLRDASERDGRRRIGAEIDDACREVGFFAVVGHDIDHRILGAARDRALEFFDLPLADRMAVAMPEPGYPYGYNPLSAESLSRSLGEGGSPPDLKETFNVGPVDPPPRPVDDMDDPDERAVYAPNLWPSALPSLRPAVESYYRAMSELAASLMDLFAVALGLDDGWFDPLIDRHGSALRLAHYPALDRPPPAGALRAGAHTDYGTLTILQLDDEPGLQACTTGGEWLDVVAPADGLVVNLGDLMERWTNDRWRSTMHRVVIPTTDAGCARRRLTMPFFHNANWDAVVECIVADGERPRHQPVTAGRHLMEKFRSTVI